MAGPCGPLSRIDGMDATEVMRPRPHRRADREGTHHYSLCRRSGERRSENWSSAAATGARSSQPLSRILCPPRGRAAAIYLGRALPRTSTRPTRSSEGTGRSLSPEGTCPCLALLPVGFAWPRRSPASPVVSYTTISPLPRTCREAVSFLWHSAVGSPRLAVSQHRALWSPDFPRPVRDAAARPARA